MVVKQQFLSSFVNIAFNHIHTIAVIDDDPAVRDSFRLLLQDYGFHVREFSSAAAFLGAPQKFCCLLIDLAMPETDGLQLLELLRLGDVQTPGILMVDKEEPKLASRIRAANAYARLVKPIAEGKLLRAIAGACEAGHNAN